MSFFKTLAEKPWQTQTAGANFDETIAEPYRIPQKIALRFFLGIVGVIFFLFMVTFLSRTQYPDFQALAGEPWKPFTDSTLLWFNTGALLLASIFLQLTKTFSRNKNINGVIFGLLCSTVFTLVFLFGQIHVWNQLASLGYFMTSNPANSYFYLFTAIHGLHLIGGLFALANVAIPFFSTRSFEALTKSLDLCKTYWHFLFIIWILLFLLLTGTSETYNTIAVLCGF